MLILLFLITILLIADTLLLALMVFSRTKQDVPAEAPQMSEEEFKDFAKTDQESAQAFLDALSNLNAYMTGNEEETNVEQQER